VITSLLKQLGGEAFQRGTSQLARQGDNLLPVLDMAVRGAGIEEGIAPLLKGLDPARAAALREAAEATRRTTPPTRPIPTSTPAMRQGEMLTRSGGAQNFTGNRRPFIRTTEIISESGPQMSRGAVPTTGVADPRQGRLFDQGAPEPEFGLPASMPRGNTAPVAYSETAIGLAKSDPGTFSAIREMAGRAEDYYGIPRGGLVNDLVEPGGTDIIRLLDEGMSLENARNMVSRGGGMVPPAGRAPTEMTQSTRGGALARRGQGGEMSTGSEFTNIPVDVNVIDVDDALLASTRAANTGARLMDLKKLVAAGALPVGLGLAGLGLERTFNNTEEAPSKSPSMSDFDSSMSEDPAVLFTENDGAPLGESQSTANVPMTPLNNAPGSYTTRGDERDSNRRAAMQQADPARGMVERAFEPRDPSTYKSIADYYADRQRYVSNPAVANEIVSQAREITKDRENAVQLDQWAKANPALAYQLVQRSMADPTANQQNPESVTTTEVTSPMGSDNEANAIGNSEAVGQTAFENPRLGQAVNGLLQQAVEMRDATRPQIQPKLQRREEFVRENAPMYNPFY
jgi:hypothetical protein